MSAAAIGLLKTARRDLAVFFSYIDGVEVRLQGNAVLGITGGPTADFNMGLFDEGPDEIALFEEFVARVAALGLPAVFMLSSAASGRLGPIAAAKGLFDAGTAPLMSLPAASAVTHSTDFTIKRVTDSAGMSIFADLAASAFGMDRPWCGRTFAAASMLEAPQLEFFVANRGDVPMSGVATTATGSTVGIWTMSTPPDKQRQGAGRAVLLAAMDHHRKCGAETFYLIATPAGKPLYDSLSFTTIDELPIWVVGSSVEVATH